VTLTVGSKAFIEEYLHLHQKPTASIESNEQKNVHLKNKTFSTPKTTKGTQCWKPSNVQECQPPTSQ